MRYGIDLETGIFDGVRRIVTIQLWNPEVKSGFIFDLRKETDKEQVYFILSNPDSEFVAFEAQGDSFLIKKDLGFDIKIVGDAYLLALLLQEKETSLNDLSLKYLRKGKAGDLKSLTEGTFDFNRELTPELIAYAIEDAHLALELEEKMFAQFLNMEKIYKLELSVLPVLVNMRFRGLRVDMPALGKGMEKLEESFNNKMKSLWDQAGFEFDVNTRKMAPVMEAVGVEVPVVLTEKGKQSYAMPVLEQVTDSEFVSTLIEARHISSVISSKSDVYDNIDKNGVLHPEFRQINYSGSARIYTSKPSANQMPAEIRCAVVPKEGKKFWYIDWKGAEIIYLAYLSNEMELIKWYEAGGDIHRFVIGKMLKKDPLEVTDEERKISKVVTFSIIFGSAGHAASRAAKVSVSQAMEWVSLFYNSFPRIDSYMRQLVISAEKKGAVYTWLGRKRVLYKLFSKDESIKNEGRRQAKNTPVQNGVADLQKWALIRIAKSLPKLDLVFTVFDSFLLEVEESLNKEDYIEDFKRIFTFVKEGKIVKFDFEIKEGYNWGSFME